MNAVASIFPTPSHRQIAILLCTWRRDHVADTLASINAQVLPLGVTLHLIVVDNDTNPSAAERVDAARAGGWPITYLHAPANNISLARNACLDAAEADFVAFIDDDEIAAPDWIARLLAHCDATAADAVFGPSIAVYPSGAPEWMRAQDHHSNHPVRRRGVVETGHTCNALLRLRGMAWASERFDLARGQSGGEDTEYFFRIGRLGARFEVANDACVFEAVEPRRLDIAWLCQRKFRMGQSYASSATHPIARAALFVSAAAKAVYCRARLRAATDAGAQAFWRLRGAMHAGVCAACRGAKSDVIYGT